MTDKAQRKALTAEYRQKAADAGVYRIHNTSTDRSLVASTTSLASMRNRVEFGRSTKSTAAFDYRLHDDIREHGFEALSFEVLETLEPDPEASRDRVQSDLAALEDLWREKIGEDRLY